jgi:hypothetical protein
MPLMSGISRTRYVVLRLGLDSIYVEVATAKAACGVAEDDPGNSEASWVCSIRIARASGEMTTGY